VPGRGTHDPLAGLARGGRLGDDGEDVGDRARLAERRAHAAKAGPEQVVVRVDEAGHDHPAAEVQYLCARPNVRAQVGRAAQCDDPSVARGQPFRPRRIGGEGQHARPREHQVGRAPLGIVAGSGARRRGRHGSLQVNGLAEQCTVGACWSPTVSFAHTAVTFRSCASFNRVGMFAIRP
jgi:hypothetical protein